MNPIFSRRSRPPPAPANGSQNHHRRSSSPHSPRHIAELAEDACPPAFLSPTSKHQKLTVGAPINANLAVQRFAATNKAAQDAHDQMLLAQNFLASKQNLLAQSALTPSENSARRQGESRTRRSHSPASVGGACASNMSDSEDPADEVTAFTSVTRKSSDSGNGAQQARDEAATMDFCDIEDEDFDFGDVDEPCSSTRQIRAACDNSRRIPGAFGNIDCNVSCIDAKLWKDLKAVVIGPNGSLLDGWHYQGFTFDTCLPYGLVQKRGGPCGVLAVVQSLVLRNLMFGSPYAEDGDDELPFPEPVVNYAADPTFNRMISARRTKALVLALTEILWRCSQIGSKGYFNFDRNREELSQESPTYNYPKICLSPNNVGAEIRHFNGLSQLRNFIGGNLAKLDCANFIYSAVLSRGIQTVQEDFDFPNCPLLGAHGYCSQELVNLLSTGKAVSNVFDNQVPLDGKVLKGIEARADIGFLSLFEHYDSCQVGTHLKCPRFPIWIVCSESHFSVLFSMDKDLAQDMSGTFAKFDLYYYDGLAKQQNHIKLTVDTSSSATRFPSTRSYFSGNNNNEEGETDDDLVPPLEKCIRTKWKSAAIDWNKTEPIL